MHAPHPQLATRVLPAVASAIAEAAGLIRDGQLAAFPTETVYGLGANALNEHAIAAIFAVKERPRFNPLIVHALDREQARNWVEFNPIAERLADAFWPGGLTLVLPRITPSKLAYLLSAGLDTVAIRCPAHSVARDLLGAAGVPIAAPSANRSGRVSATDAVHVLDELDGRIPLILDAGPSSIGLESTVIGFENERPVLLRPGAIARETIESVIGPLDQAKVGLAAAASQAMLAPGMMASHYAPAARLRLNARVAEPGEALLAFGAHVPLGPQPTCNLSPSGDLQEAAANLFSMLRKLDRSGAKTIAVMPVPAHDLGEAINDRLARAAAPREG